MKGKRIRREKQDDFFFFFILEIVITKYNYYERYKSYDRDAACKGL
jgi:hypothetical protein